MGPIFGNTGGNGNPGPGPFGGLPFGGKYLLPLIGAGASLFLPGIIDWIVGKPPKPAPPLNFPPPAPAPGSTPVEQAFSIPWAAMEQVANRSLDDLRAEMSRRGVTGESAAHLLSQADAEMQGGIVQRAADIANARANALMQQAQMTGYYGGNLTPDMYQRLFDQAVQRANITGVWQEPLFGPGGYTPQQYQQLQRQQQIRRFVTGLVDAGLRSLWPFLLKKVFG